MPRWSFTYMSALVALTAVVLAGCPAPPSPDSRPEANFTADVRLGNTGLTVTFSDLSTTVTGGAIASWQWNFGDGGQSSEPNPIHTYLAPGDFTVSLTVVSAGGNHTRTRPNYIRIDSPAGSDQLDSDGGTISANGVSITVPAGALEGRVDFGITRVATQIEFNVFEPINRVGDTFRIVHNSDTELSASSTESPVQTTLLAIPYAEDVVPTGDRTSAKVHIIAQLASGSVVPIFGRITAGSVEARVTNLPADARYSVIYRPDAYFATATVQSKTPTSLDWEGKWQLSLSPALLKQLTALRLGSVLQASSFFETEFSEDELAETEDLLLEQLVETQQTLESRNARGPRLVATDGAYRALCFNFALQYSAGIESLDAVLYAGSPFGSIVVDPQQLLAISTWNADRIDADPEQVDIAFKLEAPQAIAEVLARAVVDGYDYPEILVDSAADDASVPFENGIKEGLALHLGQLSGSRPFNRSQLPGDVAFLSSPPFAPLDPALAGYAVASQDFLRYGVNRYGLDFLNVLIGGDGGSEGLLEETRLSLAGTLQSSAADAALVVSMALNESSVDVLNVPIGAVYYNYALDVAFEHGDSAVLRPSDQDRLPLVLDESRFGAGAILTGTLTTPNSGLDFPSFGQLGLNNISPLSARVVVVKANPAADELLFTFNRAMWNSDTSNRGIEVVVYREGLPALATLPASDSTLSFGGFQADSGQATADFFVLVVNTSSSTASSVAITVESSTAAE